MPQKTVPPNLQQAYFLITGEVRYFEDGSTTSKERKVNAVFATPLMRITGPDLNKMYGQLQMAFLEKYQEDQQELPAEERRGLPSIKDLVILSISLLGGMSPIEWQEQTEQPVAPATATDKAPTQG